MIDRAGLPFIGGALAPGLVLLVAGRPGWALACVAAAALFAFFFRDPERVPPPGDHLVLAPADGRVLVAGDADPAVSPPGRWLQVSIFLSPLDVHVNRIPVSGRIVRVRHERGPSLPAYRPEAARNARTEVWIEHGPQTIVIRQVVGILARRIVCRVREGDRVEAGQRFGVMKFGSRMDVFLPPGARLRVRRGQHVRAGETVLAEL
ncbi:MAG TPA: phosphatidylserine decarboxylase [Vicinamibacterales bacterium]|nr:phosphatidylserine decarboxylase [Vicinamibacterales bacterium]